MASVLVVYYSRSGGTRIIAEEITSTLKADIEEIEDTVGRSGPIGWLRAGKDAGERNLTKLKPLRYDPADYDLVVVGSPVWNGTVSTPIRTYLTEQRDRIKTTAFWVSGFKTDNNAITEMTEIINGEPVAVLRLLGKEEVQAGQYRENLDAFLSEISQYAS